MAVEQNADVLLGTPPKYQRTAHFHDSTSATEALLIGADGISSRTRAALLASTPELGRNRTTPVRMRYTGGQDARLRSFLCLRWRLEF